MTQNKNMSAMQKPAAMNALSEETLMAIREAVQASALPSDEELVDEREVQSHSATEPAAMRPEATRSNNRRSASRVRTGGGFVKLLPSGAKVAAVLTPRRLAIAIILMSIWLKPLFLPTAFLIFAFVTAFICLALGPDRCQGIARWGWARFSKRRPEKAESLRIRFNKRRSRLQARLDKLPQGWVRGLHLPHWQSDQRAEAAESAFASRMSNLARDAHAEY